MEKNSNMEFVFAIDPTDKPDLIVSIKKINHVHLGLYKGFEINSKKLVTHYFWAEYDRTGSLYRCLVSKGDDMKQWCFDAVSSQVIAPYMITEIQSNILKEIETNLSSIVNQQGLLTTKYKSLLKKQDYVFIKNNAESRITMDEMVIIETLKSDWKIDAVLSFSVV